MLRDAGAALLAVRIEAGAWPLMLEYEITRKNRRIDAVLLAGPIVVLEFKVGAKAFDGSAVVQARDYALDLRDFHQQSQGRTILPALVATGIIAGGFMPAEGDLRAVQGVGPVAKVHPGNLSDFLLAAASVPSTPIDGQAWNNSSYLPAPGIVQAALQIFHDHEVKGISHSTAENLHDAVEAVVRFVQLARKEKRRILCVLTGVPGAGKTLAGLAAVHAPKLVEGGIPAGVFLSGNGPLVKILKAAIEMDSKSRGAGEARREVSTFIQNVHTFLDEYVKKHPKDIPPEHLVTFDEAQRAWDADMMKKKREINRSEAELMLEVMERVPDWAVVVALVGGGQEIYEGEAGLAAWGKAARSRGATWTVVTSPEALSGGASVAGAKLFEDVQAPVAVLEDPALHLRVSVRSLRSTIVSDWVAAVLDGAPDRALALIKSPGSDFPVVCTRSLEQARAWLRGLIGNELDAGLAGLVASSEAKRLRPHGIEVSSGFRLGLPYSDWFLRDQRDIRSSQQLEVAATEFECQGLELDWVGVCWGDDLTQTAGHQWEPRRLSGGHWQVIREPTRFRNRINAYRVLLTRARKGMVIWIPPGDIDDPTREPERLDRTAVYLESCGAERLL